jgi:hypothetical protein
VGTEIQTQDIHPSQDGPVADPDAAPKIADEGTGATVGTGGSGDEAAAFATEHAKSVIASDEGFLGHNPDPLPNEAYTLPGQIAARGEVASSSDVDAEAAPEGETA